MAKRSIDTVIYIARGDGWHITMDRQTRDYAAFIDGDTLALLGFYRTEQEARSAVLSHTFETLRRTA